MYFFFVLQMDFHQGGSCAVQGADLNSEAISDFISNNKEHIEEIIVALDSHHVRTFIKLLLKIHIIIIKKKILYHFHHSVCIYLTERFGLIPSMRALLRILSSLLLK